MDQRQANLAYSSFLDIIGRLRAQNLNYHHAHTLVSGPTFAGDHALLQRLYFGEDDAEGAPILEIDSVMERAQGVFPEHPIGPVEILTAMQPYVLPLISMPRPEWWRALLENERGLQRSLAAAIKVWESVSAAQPADVNAQGVVNLLQGISDQHAVNVYLLQQRSRTTA